MGPGCPNPSNTHVNKKTKNIEQFVHLRVKVYSNAIVLVLLYSVAEKQSNKNYPIIVKKEIMSRSDEWTKPIYQAYPPDPARLSNN